MLFPSFYAHISDAEFQYPNRIWKEMYGIMAYLVAKSGDKRGIVLGFRDGGTWGKKVLDFSITCQYCIITLGYYKIT